MENNMNSKLNSKSVFKSFDDFANITDISELMDDMDYDESYEETTGGKNTNNYRTLAPLFIEEILFNHTSAKRPMTQKQIIECLEEEYELPAERKSIGRIVHLLATWRENIHYEKGKGAWYEKPMKFVA